MSTTLHNTTRKIDSHASKKSHVISNANRTHRRCASLGASMVVAAFVGHVANRELQVVDRLSMLA